MPDEFKAKCPVSDYTGMMLFIHSVFGYPEDSKATLGSARAKDDYGWAEIELEKDGVELEFLQPDDPETPQFEWRGDEWIVHVPKDELAEDDPCVFEKVETE